MKNVWIIQWGEMTLPDVDIYSSKKKTIAAINRIYADDKSAVVDVHKKSIHVFRGDSMAIVSAYKLEVC